MMPHDIFQPKKWRSNSNLCSFLVNKEMYSLNLQSKHCDKKKIIEKTNYQERSQKISVLLTSFRHIFL